MSDRSTPFDDRRAVAYGLIAPARRPEIPGGPQDVASVLDRWVETRGHSEALVGRHDRYTFAQLDVTVNAAADALQQLGVRSGDRVAGTLGNHPELVIAYLACMRLGAIWVGINRQLAAPERAYMLKDCETSVYLAEPDAASGIRARADDLPELRHIVTWGPSERANEHTERTDTATETEWDALLRASAAGGAERPTVTIDPFAPAAIAYTSGTTGFPKGAVHNQHNLLMPGVVRREMGYLHQGEQRIGVALPLTILNLMILHPTLAYVLGYPCICMDRIDAVGVAQWIRQERITTFTAVPAMMHDLLTHPDVTVDDLASLQVPGVGGADVPEAFRELYRQRFDREVTVGYGLTEAPTSVTGTNPLVPQLVGSSGPALAHLEVTIRSEDGAVLGTGETGEICVGPATSGPYAGVYTLMLGYWNQPEATAQALRDDVLHTGDVGYLDAAGNLFVRDRKGDMIIRGGANVYPAEIERVLHDEPRVVACAVVGEPDERLGERVVAFVQVMEGVEVSADELRAHCAVALARYKVPERFVFVDAFARTPMGKIRKTELRSRL